MQRAKYLVNVEQNSIKRLIRLLSNILILMFDRFWSEKKREIVPDYSGFLLVVLIANFFPLMVTQG